MSKIEVFKIPGMSDGGYRSRIIGKAKDLFLRKGFSKVTMDDLVRELGISKKTIYKYFPAKDDLIVAVLDTHIQKVSIEIQKIVNDPSSGFIEKLSSLWEFIGNMLTEMSVQFQGDLYRFRPDLWKRIEEIRSEKITGNLKALFEEGRRLGVLRDDIDADLVDLIYQGTIKGVINPEVLMKNPYSAADSMRAILTIFFNGLLTDDSRAYYDKKFIKARKV